eukprot:UN23448
MGHQPAAIIGFYKKSCRDFFLKLDFLNTAHYPSRPFLTIGWYDFERRPAENWMSYEDHLDMKHLLNSTDSCPEFVYVPKNYMLNKQLGEEMSREYPVQMRTTGLESWIPDEHTTEQDYHDWLWSKFSVVITFTNKANNSVRLTSKETHTDELIEVGQTFMLETFASDEIKVNYRTVYIIPHFEDDHSMEFTLINEGENIVIQESEQLYRPDQVSDWDGLLATRHQFTSFTESSNFHIPPNLPSFTPSGYKLIQMPDDVHDPLIEWYESHVAKKRNESFFPGYTIINSYTKYPSFIDLPQSKAWKIIGPFIQGLISEWSGIPANDLELTSFYGIREYHEGHFLRPHVDRSETHVLSVILHLLKILQ